MKESDAALVERCAVAHFAAWVEMSGQPVTVTWDRVGGEIRESSRVAARAVLVEAGLLDRCLTDGPVFGEKPHHHAGNLLDFEMEETG